MRVAIETSPFRSPLAGVGYYIYCLIEALLPQLADGEALLAFNGLGLRPINSAYIREVDEQNVARTVAAGRSSHYQNSVDRIYSALRLIGPVRSAGRRLKQGRLRDAERHFDIFHATNFGPPAPLTKPALPVIYDLSHRRYPQAHPKERVEWLERGMRHVHQVPLVQTISEFSKQEIVQLLGVAEERIHVTYPGIHRQFTAAASDADLIQLQSHGVKAREYFMVVATREPRKNFKTVAEAYSALPERVRERMPLLWIGQRGWGNVSLSRAIRKREAQGQIRITGYLADSTLAALYRHTALFMMPSVYEGFGLPVVEALACGAPVAVSAIAVFREVAGSFARYVDPFDVEGWRAAMLQAHDGGPVAPMPADLRRHLERFSWADNAAETLKLYRTLNGLKA